MHPELIGIFPSPTLLGGIQASGREAWRGISEQLGNESIFCFDYQPAAGKVQAAISALKNHKRTETVLVWHLNLLRLVPLLTHARRSVVFLHGIEAWRKLDRITSWALHHTDLILANSRYTWERFVSANPAFRSAFHRVVHLGAGEPIEGAAPAPAATPIALMLGRMARAEDYKGHRQMIEAWPQVLRLRPQAQLWIAGDGDLSPELEVLTNRLGMKAQVRFLRRVSDVQKEILLQQCRCLTLPSRGEGFGLVYLEAMRAGRPCLISNQDAAREVVDPPCGGLAVDPGNLFEIAKATARLLSDSSEWHGWSTAARQRYEQHFTAAHFHRRLNAALLAA